jgi:sulfur-oxidizing protein SoxX
MTGGGRIARGAMALAMLFAGAALTTQGAQADGQNLAFDRAKGNCLTCHEIKGGPAPGNLGPPLADMKARFPNRKDLIAIVSDETKRDPLTVMPPFKRNLILTDKEIEEIVDFLQTL